MWSSESRTPTGKEQVEVLVAVKIHLRVLAAWAVISRRKASLKR